MEFSRRRGFTLIELSIVLVIIGLIVGGVLVGRDLIKAAQLRAVIKEETQFETAVNTFIGKYGCLPGDCANMTTFLPANASCGAASPGSSGVCNGNGDGVICANTGTCTGALESLYAAQDLAVAGMVNWPLSTPMDTSQKFAGLPETIPGANIFGSSWQSMGWTIQSFEGIAGPLPTNNYCSTVIAPPPSQIVFQQVGLNSAPGIPGAFPTILNGADAYAIDLKIDDGMPFTGKVAASNNGGFGSSFYVTANCGDAGLASATYHADAAHFGPGLVFLTNFSR